MKKSSLGLFAGLAAMAAAHEDYSHLDYKSQDHSYRPSRNRTKAQNKRRAKGLRGRKARKINFNH